MRTDSEIQRDVENELEWDPNVDARNIAVKVTDGGVVTLTGFTSSYMDKYSAERIAKRILGVKAVANDLEVKLATGSERPDPDIARDAVKRLQSDLPYSSKNIKVTVRNAWITLEGDVDWDFQRRSAEAAVRNIKGVKGVINLLLGVWAIFDLGLGMLALSYLFAFQALFAGFTLLALAYHLRERKVEETADSTANFDAKAPQEAPHA